jgi:hypothetical protein
VNLLRAQCSFRHDCCSHAQRPHVLCSIRQELGAGSWAGRCTQQLARMARTTVPVLGTEVGVPHTTPEWEGGARRGACAADSCYHCDMRGQLTVGSLRPGGGGGGQVAACLFPFAGSRHGHLCQEAAEQPASRTTRCMHHLVVMMANTCAAASACWGPGLLGRFERGGPARAIFGGERRGEREGGGGGRGGPQPAVTKPTVIDGRQRIQDHPQPRHAALGVRSAARLPRGGRSPGKCAAKS